MKKNNILNFLYWYGRKFFNEIGHYDVRFFKEEKSAEVIRETLVGMLEVLVKEFERLDILYWLDGGALLGAYRNGKFIPWDTDIDVSMMRKDVYRLEEIRLNTEKYLFEINPHAYFSWRDKKNAVDARLIHKETGLYVDVIMFREDGKTVLREKGYGYNHGKRSSGHVFPIGRILFENMTVNCPNRIHDYLVAKYKDIT